MQERARKAVVEPCQRLARHERVQSAQGPKVAPSEAPMALYRLSDFPTVVFNF